MSTSDNYLKSSNKSNRKEIFRKLAKKEAKPLLGKQNRKSIEKILGKTTEQYKELKKVLDKAVNDKLQLDDFIVKSEEQLKKHRKDIMNCHDYLKHIDFSGAHELKIDNDDVAYIIDGKPYHYDFETGDKKPYGQWKREQKATTTETNNVDDNAVEDNNDVNVDTLDPDGVDITI